MRIVVTGGSGFIGRQVLKALEPMACGVVVSERRGWSDDPAKVSRYSASGVEVMPGDLIEPPFAHRLMRGSDAVCHLAWSKSASARGTVEDRPVYENLRIVDSLLQACIRQGVRRFVFVSTVAVYGWEPHRSLWPVTEAAPLLGRGAYPVGKITAEALVRRVCEAAGISYIILRPCLVYGPGAEKVQDFVRRIATGASDVGPGQFRKTWHWVHVTDVARAIIQCLTESSPDRGVFNIAGPEAIRHPQLTQLVRHLGRRSSGQGTALDPIQLPADDQPPVFLASVAVSKYDTTRARRELNFDARVSLPLGLTELLVDAES